MNKNTPRTEAADVILSARPNLTPQVGIILGSGLDSVSDSIQEPSVIAYGGLPGFPEPSVEGHQGELILGGLGGKSVACLRGRAHYYEGRGADVMQIPIRTLAAIGCEILILTNAAGSLRPDMATGSLMVITDHINFAGTNPLIGDPSGNNRFVNMSNAYDRALRDKLSAAATELGIDVHQGVYMWFNGPSFETPAEIRMAQTLGADAVGMSTVPEVILARQAGLRVAALSNITNLGAGMVESEDISHEHTMKQSAKGADKLRQLILKFLGDL